MHSCWINVDICIQVTVYVVVWINKFSQVICTLTEIPCWAWSPRRDSEHLNSALLSAHNEKEDMAKKGQVIFTAILLKFKSSFSLFRFSPLLAMSAWGIYLGTSISLFVSDSAALTEPDNKFKLRTHHIFSTSFLITVVLLWQCVVLLFSVNCEAASVLICLASGKASDNKPLTLNIKLHIFTHNSPVIADMNDTADYKLRLQTAGLYDKWDGFIH